MKISPAFALLTWVLVLFLVGCGGGNTIKSTEAQAFVESFLQASASTDANEPKDEALRPFIQLEPVKAKGGTLNDYHINYYAYQVWKITKVDGEYVYAEVKNNDGGWTRTFTFRLVREKGQLKLVPGKVDSMDEEEYLRYLDPWFKTESN
jgi:hypothetical protein